LLCVGEKGKGKGENARPPAARVTRSAYTFLSRRVVEITNRLIAVRAKMTTNSQPIDSQNVFQ